MYDSVVSESNGQNMGSRPTVKEVAERADVAVGTVSRYLNGQNVRESNRARIEQAIAELGYRMDFIARGMKTRRTMTVGVVLPGFDQYHSDVLSGLEQSLSSRGYMAIVCDYMADARVLREKLEFLMTRHVDAFIISPPSRSKEPILDIQSRNRPVVLINNSVPGVLADHVGVSDRSAAFEAVQHLLEYGHTRIAMLSGPNSHTTAIERSRGYIDALEAHGLAEEESLTRTADWSYVPDGDQGTATGDGVRASVELLRGDGRPTALFCANQMLGIAALHAIRELGLRIPQDVSLVVFDDSATFRLVRPGITVVRQPTARISEAAADLVVRRLTSEARDGFPEDIRVSAELIARQSVARPSAAPAAG
jgi:LacI family transcriptional regulator